MASEADIQVIVASAKRGHRESYAELFRVFYDRIYRFIRIRLSDDAAAEDLTQTVFVEMIQALPRYKVRTGVKFSTWLFQIARFRLIDHYRATRVIVPLEDDDGALVHPSLTVDPPDVTGDEAIDRAFVRLPERYQTVLHLRFREDLSYADVARIMETTILNVRVLQHRALRALRRILER